MSPSEASRGSRVKTTPKALRTRQRLYESSLSLFKEKGFDETSMRDIAGRTGLSLGSTYYYFDSKHALVYEYYVRSQDDAARRNDEACRASTSFAERLRDLLEFKLGQLDEARSVVVVLARSALDPSHPISPFSPETAAVRDESIEMLDQVVEGSDLRVHKELRPHLARVLWLYQMAMIFFWIHDRSEGQQRTRRVVDASLALLVFLLPLTATRLPGMRKTVRLLAQLLADVAFWQAGADTRDERTAS